MPGKSHQTGILTRPHLRDLVFKHPSSQGLGRGCAPCFLGAEGPVGWAAGKDSKPDREGRELSTSNPEGLPGERRRDWEKREVLDS